MGCIQDLMEDQRGGPDVVWKGRNRVQVTSTGKVTRHPLTAGRPVERVFDEVNVVPT